MKDLKKKSILLGVSVVMVVVAAILFTYAWYTKMTSVNGLDFNVARWDFNASKLSDDVLVDVYRYAAVNEDKAAPGTSGEIPVELSAEDSDVDVAYKITLDNSIMSEEFQKRLIFTYKNASGQVKSLTYTDGPEGIIVKETSSIVKLYWHWVYDYDEAVAKGLVTEEDDMTAAEKEAAAAAWDEFDTKVGMNPELYSTQMRALIHIQSSQVQPTETTAAATTAETTTEAETAEEESSSEASSEDTEDEDTEG